MFIVLFAAVISAGCFISIPLPGGVPITLQNILVIIAALTMGGIDGFLAALLFLGAGLIGMPVFSGGRGGIAIAMGPTGGFLLGYAAGALVAGLIARKPDTAHNSKGQIARLALGSVAGLSVILLCGTLRFMCMTGRSLVETLFVCVVPFLPGDAIKVVLGVLVSAKLRSTAARFQAA